MTHTVQNASTPKVLQQTLSYAYGGNTDESSLTLPSGYSTYICNDGNWDYDTVTYSWVADASTTWSSVGRQSSNVCTTSTGEPGLEDTSTGDCVPVNPSISVDNVCVNGAADPPYCDYYVPTGGTELCENGAANPPECDDLG